MSSYHYNPDGSINRPTSSRVNSREPTHKRQGNDHHVYPSSGDNYRKRESRDLTDDSRLKVPKVELPWHYDNDKLFFADGQGSHAIRRYTAEYYEFQEFYKRFLVHRSKSGLSGSEMPASHGSLAGIFDRPDHGQRKSAIDLESEAQFMAEALGLFEEFLRQKRADHASSTSKDRMSLPIYSRRQQILDTIRNNQVTIIAAETGAGKSTQVPQYLLEDGYRRIACTQPRRIACLSLAKRVLQERIGWPGASSQDVGYQIRFEKSFTGRNTADAPGAGPKALFLTEGILLRQIRSDLLLNQYDMIIIDEVHERHAMVDFLLGLLKQVLRIRPQLKLVLMSATIQSELFSSYFSNAPLISVPGQTYPVDIEYVPNMGPKGNIELDLNLVSAACIEERLRQQDELGFTPSIRAPTFKFDVKPYLEILKLIDAQYSSKEGGHVLIFMSGYQEIQQLYTGLEEYVRESKRWILLKLHSALSMKQQDKVFRPTLPGIRKCIMSTNIAETSVTLPEIRFIIDSGRVKELEWDSSAKLKKLSEVWISQASARQRSGRAGRTGPGRCWRLYGEEEFIGLNGYSTAELVRGLSLDQIILQLKAIDISNKEDGALIELDPVKFEFVQTPPKDNMTEAMKLLRQVGALDNVSNITPLGNELSFLPLDVILGKMIIYGRVFHMTDWVMLITSALSVSSPFLREDFQISRQQNSQGSAIEYGTISKDAQDWNKEKSKFESSEGDPFTLICLLQNWIRVQYEGRISSRKWCSKISVEEQRLYEMIKLISQFKAYTSRDRPRDVSTARSRTQKQAFGAWQKQKVTEQVDDEKLLTVDNQADEEFDEDEPDLLLLEFRAKLDVDSLYREFARLPFTDLSRPEKALLQLLLCSGLYPNIALPDPANHSRRPADRVFHTKHKRFALMHPSSVFAKHPEWVPKIKSTVNHTHDMPGMSTESVNLQISMAHEGDLDIVDFQGVQSRFDESRKPVSIQTPALLCFVQIMETSKPFLMNVFPVSALLSTFLFGGTIDTNRDLTYVIVDEWIVLEFKSRNRLIGQTINSVTGVVAELIRKMIRFRDEWGRRVDNNLGSDSRSKNAVIRNNRLMRIENDEHAFMNAEIKAMVEGIFKDSQTTQARSERPHEDFLAHLDLILDIDDFLHERGVFYEVDVLKGDDALKLFPPTIDGTDVPDSMRLSVKLDEKQKFGIQVLEYFNYGTVQYPYSLFEKKTGGADRFVNTKQSIGVMRGVKRVWQCPTCNQSIMATDLDIQIHQIECKEDVDAKKGDSMMQEPLPFKKPASAVTAPTTTAPGTTSKSNGYCQKCGIKLPATPIEKLRHKKVCGKY